MISEEKKEKIKELYSKKVSLTKIGEKLNISRQWISRYLKSEGIEIINYQNKAKFNFNFFDKIDSEEKAYWLGFLYADGSVSYFNNTLELSLKLNDYKHLNKFKEALKSKLIVKTDHFRCRFAITNKHLKERLIELGCTPRKSNTLKFPTNEQVPREYLNHFIRGYFDGDGHIRYNGENTNRPLFMLYGTKEFLLELIKITNLPLNLKRDKRHKNNTYFISYFGINSINFLNYIYKDSSIYLDRKFKVYNNSFAVLGSNT